MDVDFTANMERSLDNVAEGKVNWVDLLSQFTGGFNPTLEKAQKEMASVKGGIETDIVCKECGKPMVIKFGKAGQFLACTGYPECRNTSDFVRDAKGAVQVVEREEIPQEAVGVCPDCGKDLVLKKARTGSRFIGCSGYPDCRHTKPFPTGVKCPRCDGQLVEKSSRRGKVFYACDQYPNCDYAVWDWPLDEPCPECDSKVLVKKTTKARGEHIACPERSCKYWREIEDNGEEGGE